jgi:hypothetical protein
MNPICFYHKADLDGVCSGAIVKHFVPECELYGFDYGDKFPWDKVRPGQYADTDPLWAEYFEPENGYVGPEQNGGLAMEVVTTPKRTVYMVDVSLPPADMKRLAGVSDLIWIDHHASCEALWNEINPLGMFRTNYAACELTWEWCILAANANNEPRWLANNLKTQPFRERVPEAVRLLGRYNVWDKDNPDWAAKILPFQYGMRAESWSTDPTHEMWKSVLGLLEPRTELSWLLETRKVGRAILSSQAEQNVIEEV